MAAEERGSAPRDDALAPMPPGELHWLRAGALQVALAPRAGGRIAQIRFAGMDWLVGPDDGWPATIAWGCYPMVPWAGRMRAGRFRFDDREYRLPVNFGAHAIHGVGFSRPWRLDARDAHSATLSLSLPDDAHWPFGGTARQSVVLGNDALRLELSVQAGGRAMPAEIGWHPWFRKPDRLEFAPAAMYPRDADGIPTLPRIAPTPGPWDDCFLALGGAALERAGQRLRLTSGATHWVVYDAADHATCVEPQSGPPDGFNLAPKRLEPGESLDLALDLAWTLEDGAS